MTDDSVRRQGIPDPIEPPVNDNSESWGSGHAKTPWYNDMRAKAGAVGALLLASLGLSLYILNPAAGADEAKPADSPIAPLISEKALSRLNMDQQESTLQCEERFMGGPRIGEASEGQRVVIRNLHSHPILLSFFDHQTKEKLAVVGIESRSSEEALLPINSYTIEALTGTDWCSMEVGFRQGARVTMREVIQVSEETLVRLEFVQDGPRPRDFQPRLFETPIAKRAQIAAQANEGNHPQASTDTSPTQYVTGSADSPKPRSQGGDASTSRQERAPEPYQVIGDGSLVLRQVFGNSYFVTGTVNNFPVVFTVDPGAPALVLPQHIAARAGVRSCVQRQIATTSGNVRGCAARIDDIRFGELRVRNAEALILPTPTGDAIIGMNVLSRFKVVQANSTISITTQKVASLQ